MNEINKIEIDEFGKLNMLLNSAELPLVDINDQTEHFYKIDDTAGNIAGAIGLEVYGNYGLLRSLVVEKEYRGKGIARKLVQKVIDQAQILGLKKVILLTTTADIYFEKLQFERIHRNDVPQEIMQSKEFKSICPVSAIVMQKSI